MWWHADAYRTIGLRPPLSPHRSGLDRSAGARVRFPRAALGSGVARSTGSDGVARAPQLPILASAVNLGGPINGLDYLDSGRLVTKTDSQRCWRWTCGSDRHATTANRSSNYRKHRRWDVGESGCGSLRVSRRFVVLDLDASVVAVDHQVPVAVVRYLKDDRADVEEAAVVLVFVTIDVCLALVDVHEACPRGRAAQLYLKLGAARAMTGWSACRRQSIWATIGACHWCRTLARDGRTPSPPCSTASTSWWGSSSGFEKPRVSTLHLSFESIDSLFE